jgi:leucyl/phenylalanyl-tRNA--protein transferase
MKPSRTMVRWLRPLEVPDPCDADGDGLVAIGGSLDPDLLLKAYRRGVFPWSSVPEITWWSPDPRAIFDLATWKPHRTILQSMRRRGWTCTVNERFGDVVRACAARTADRPETWITRDFIASYTELHRRGHAISVEVLEEGVLVGGLYGVVIGGFFGGESMFHRRVDASKAAFVHLVDHLKSRGFALLDAQAPNDHLIRLGATLVPREKFLSLLKAALRKRPRQLL